MNGEWEKGKGGIVKVDSGRDNYRGVTPANTTAAKREGKEKGCLRGMNIHSWEGRRRHGRD